MDREIFLIDGDRCRKQYLLCSEFFQVVPSTPSPGLPVGMGYSSFRPGCLSTGTPRETLYRQTAVSDVGIALLFIATKRTIAIFRAIGQLGVFH
jgi:hypothetical protein